MSVEVFPQSGALGAEIGGVDLSEPLDDATFEAIHRAFLDHQVIFLRGQSLTPLELRSFALRFGTPNDYPFAEGLPECPEVISLVKEPHETTNFGGHWHSDTTYLETPPLATILHAKDVPVAGGDTLFANMYLAYDSLSGGMKTLLGGLTAVNIAASPDFSKLVAREERDGYASINVRNLDRLDMSAEHPVVRTHPETGRKALYINETHTSNLKDMTPEESLPIIGYVCRQATRPEHTFRLRWEEGMLTVWDNRCVQHYALNDYHGHRRVMHRMTVAGERPA